MPLLFPMSLPSSNLFMYIDHLETVPCHGLACLLSWPCSDQSPTVRARFCSNCIQPTMDSLTHNVASLQTQVPLTITCNTITLTCRSRKHNRCATSQQVLLIMSRINTFLAFAALFLAGTAQSIRLTDIQDELTELWNSGHSEASPAHICSRQRSG